MITRLKEFIDNQGISISAFEQKISASDGMIRRAIRNNTDIQSKWIAKISDNYPDLSLTWLITGKGQMFEKNESKGYEKEEPHQIVNEPEISMYKLKTDYYGVERQKIPLYEVEASAGLNALFSNNIQQVPLDYISVPNAPSCDGAVYVRGDSMYPILKSGDIACYKTIYDINNVYFGEMHLVDADIEGDQYLTFKYVQRSEKGDEYVTLVSHNPHYAPRDILKTSIRAIALVKLSIRYNTIS